MALAGPSQLLVTRIGAGRVMTAGMALIAGGTAWATAAGVHGGFWADLAGPFFVAGAGTAFTFIPISIAGLTGVAERDAGLASGLLNTTQQLGGAIGVAVASTVAASRTATLAATGHSTAAALTGGFQAAFWVCTVIAALAVPVGLLIPRRAQTQPEPVTPVDTAAVDTATR